MSRPNALVLHQRRAAQRKARMVASGELPASAAGGRKAVPTKCIRCGVTQPSARAAWMHCRASRQHNTQ